MVQRQVRIAPIAQAGAREEDVPKLRPCGRQRSWLCMRLLLLSGRQGKHALLQGKLDGFPPSSTCTRVAPVVPMNAYRSPCLVTPLICKHAEHRLPLHVTHVQPQKPVLQTRLDTQEPAQQLKEGRMRQEGNLAWGGKSA